MKDPIFNLRSRLGFTLIEVTIAITLLALLAVIVYGAFYLGHRAVEKTQARSEHSQRLRSAGDLLAGYIRSGYPYRFSPQQPRIFFSGATDRLIFVSAVSLGMGGRGMSKVSISWDGDGIGDFILEEEIPVRFEDREAAPGYRNRVVLAQAVRDFRMNYLFTDPRSGEESWFEEWDGNDRNALPQAVRMTYRNPTGEEIHWVFPIMMNVLAP